MLKNKVAIVTGGTRGIGYATVKTFLDNGSKVVLFGSKKQSVDNALEQLQAENPDYIVGGAFPDLTDNQSVADAVAAVKKQFGRVDILVNNAGITAKESLYEYDPLDFQKIIDINVHAVFLCSQAVAPIMKAQGGGVILNTSSMVSLYGQQVGVGYPTSKFAVNGLTKSLARELGSDHIRVNAVAPGITETDMVKGLPEEMQKQIVKMIPLGRMGQAQDIANAFLFLASDLASYVSGEILSVDGATVM